MATDTGIVTIYDLLNGGAPLTAHRIDAKELLSHPSGRWSTSPITTEPGLSSTAGQVSDDDTGEAMRIKSLNYKTLQAMAAKAGIPNSFKMKKIDLVDALLQKQKETV